MVDVADSRGNNPPQINEQSTKKGRLGIHPIMPNYLGPIRLTKHTCGVAFHETLCQHFMELGLVWVQLRM